MKTFIAYFDYLGFKDFIMRNDLDYQKQVMRFIYRDIELALSKRKTKDGRSGRIADLSDLKISCVNFSDTVVFWTNDNSLASLVDLLETSYIFNWQQNLFTFPVRGALFYGEIFHSNFRERSAFEGLYNVNSVYGKGIVDAYLKAETLDWAGTAIDKDVVDFLKDEKADLTMTLDRFAKEYSIPYKEGRTLQEYALRIVEGGLNSVAFENLKNSITRNFQEHNKDVNHPSAKRKLENTIKYLSTFITS